MTDPSMTGPTLTDPTLTDPTLTDPTFAVVFDLDGLLVDTEPFWSESSRVLLARRGERFDPALRRRFMGRHPLEVVRFLAAHYRLPDDPAALLQERLAIINELYRAREIPAMPGARALVAALAAESIPMAVATGSPAPLLRLVLQRLGMEQPLAVHATSDEVTHGKPAPDLFLLAAGRLGMAPRCCVVLEDSIAGVEAALAAQMAVVAVPGREIAPADVARAHLVVSSLEELSPLRLAEIVQLAAHQHGEAR